MGYYEIVVCRFPEGTLYLNDETWRIIRIGEGPLGFGELIKIIVVKMGAIDMSIELFYVFKWPAWSLGVYISASSSHARPQGPCGILPVCACNTGFFS